MSLMHACVPNPPGSACVFPFREPSMMRQESPSPNSSLSGSTFAAAKPPTPTSSPKLRRRTVSGGSDQSLVRQNFDIGGEDEVLDFSSPEANNNNSRAQPVVQDKRRSSAAPDPPPAYRDSPSSEPASPGPTLRSRASPSRRVNSNKCVKRTQSLKEQLVNFFTQKNSSSSSSPSASPTSAVVDRMEASKAAVTPLGHAPVIRNARRPSSRIPQFTGNLSNGAGPAQSAVGPENGEAHVSPLYLARQFGPDDVRLSDEHGSICYDVHSSGMQLRVVKDPEASPFRSHPVDRCGVVVPSAPSSSKLHDAAELDRARQNSPSGPADNAAAGPSKKSAPRVIDFERQNVAELPGRWTRGGSMRNVQVLPDKKVRREKTASNENLVTAVNDAAVNDAASAAAAAAAAAAAGFVPRPPIAKRHSTDSEDNGVPPDFAANSSLPPRRRSLLTKKSPDAFQHQPRSSPIAIEVGRGAASPSSDLNLLVAARPDDSSDADSPTEELTSATIVPGASDGSDTSPKGSHNGINGPFPIATIRPRSNSLECLGAENPTVPQIRNPSRRVRSSKPSEGHSMPPGSPPKSVSWNLVPDVVNYDKDVSEGDGGSSRRHHHHRHRRNRSEINFPGGGRGAYKMRHAASDERIYDSRKGITNSTLIAVHESFLEQMTNILKQEMELLEEVKQEKKSMTVYREVMQKILILKAQTVKQMQDILEQHDG